MTRRSLLAAFAKQPVWRERAPMPAPPRAGLIATAWRGGLLLAGGSDWQNESKILHARTDWFEPAANDWKQLADLPAPRCDAAAATLAGQPYVFAGVVDGKINSGILRFDGQRWIEVAETDPLQYTAAAVSPRGILLFGGLTRFMDLSSATNTLSLWHPDSGIRRMASFPGRPRVSTAFTCFRDAAWCFGGAHQPVSGKLENLAEVWRYDLRRNEWLQLPDLPLKRRAWSAIPVRDRIWLLGGYRETFESDTHWYDPANRALTPAAPLPHPLADTRFVRIGKRCIQAGGETGFHIRAPWTIEARLSSTS